MLAVIGSVCATGVLKAGTIPQATAVSRERPALQTAFPFPSHGGSQPKEGGQPVLTIAQLEAAILTEEELGPEFSMVDLGAQSSSEYKRIYGAIVDEARVFVDIVLLTQATTSAAEAAYVRLNPPPPDPDEDVEPLFPSTNVQIGQPFTPTGFGNDAIAYPFTSTQLGGAPLVALLVIWNDRGVQATVDCTNALEAPGRGRLTFDTLSVAERQRDKIRAVLP